jgi:hypothetical protein
MDQFLKFILFWNKFEKLVHLVGFTIAIYSNARPYESQIPEDGALTPKHVGVNLILIFTLFICVYFGIITININYSIWTV